MSSKIMCWVALDRAAQLAEIRGDPRLQETWRATADEIREDILAHGLTDKGVLRHHYDSDALDASALLAAILDFLPGEDERLRATVNAIADELTVDGFVLRYRTGRHLGNFPQAFSHLALIEAAARIIIPERLQGH